MGQMLQSKYILWLIGLKKKKTHLYDVYKRLTSDLNIHTDRKWGHGKRYSTQVGNKRKAEAEVVILRRDKVDFKTMSIIKETKEHYEMIEGSTQKRIWFYIYIKPWLYIYIYLYYIYI